jgi:hypothetical protein
MMNLVKKLFRTDVALSELGAGVGKLRQQLSLTDHSFLLPPTLRDKDRFLRIFTLVDWMDRMDSYWLKMPPAMQAKLKFYKNKWLRLRLRQVHQLLVMSAKIRRHHGLSATTIQKWTPEVANWKLSQPKLTQQAKVFISGMEAYFAAHTS